MEKIIIVCSRPTPNGPLHLGHLSGPYLRADILKRALIQQGHSVCLVTGVDAFETYIQGTCEEKGIPCKDLVNENSKKILSDLLSAKISIDGFYDVSNNLDLFSDICSDFFGQIRGVEEKDISILRERDSKRLVVGYWLEGLCPSCDSNMGSFYCESCGSLILPDKVKEPSSKLGRSLEHFDTKWLFCAPENDNLTLVLNKIKKKYPGILSSINDDFLDHTSSDFLLGYPQDWGVSIDSKHSCFSAASILPYSNYFATMAGYQDSFNKDADTKTIAFFGKDAVTQYVYGCELLSHMSKDYKGFDYCYMNDFLLLEGNKFSTSRNHAVWISESLQGNEFQGDGIRWFLSQFEMEKHGNNFIFEDYKKFEDKTLSSVLSVLENFECLKRCSDLKPEIRQHIKCFFQSLMIERNTYLSLDNFQVHNAVKVLENSVEFLNTLEVNARKEWCWWFSELSEPFIPSIAQYISSNLKREVVSV
ncbi:class I tRNA ligase family protein [Zooshikella harenae]|uniref:Class I tRNA ligase family protein n=1 Tax=Zooshikella harenae TaxID=2827238 RepID=A0ABS5ZIW4_9GAMM|nr:class I tRNA ligase family protein [Zooshikella harenae]MBU2714021.1 class I tRNA ligase family protein [Zooshikella harenae]